MAKRSTIGHLVLKAPTDFSDHRDGVRWVVTVPPGEYPVMAEELHDGTLLDLWASVRLDGVVAPSSQGGTPGTPGTHAIVKRVRDLAHTISEHNPCYRLASGFQVCPAGPIVQKGHGKTFQALTIKRGRC